MLVRNNSSKIIGIHETSILPGHTGKVPGGYEKNPIVFKYIENGIFTIVGDAKKVAKKDQTGDAKKVAKKDSAEDEKKTDDAQGTSTDPITDSASDRQAGA